MIKIQSHNNDYELNLALEFPSDLVSVRIKQLGKCKTFIPFPPPPTALEILHAVRMRKKCQVFN